MCYFFPLFFMYKSQNRFFLRYDILLAQRRFLKSHFFVLVQTIKNLEKSNLPLIELVEMVQNVISSMQSIPGTKGSEIKNKMLQLQQKNKGFKLMIQIVKVF